MWRQRRRRQVGFYGSKVWAAMVLALAGSGPSWAAHAYALWGAPRYPAGFAHFAYVNPAAPQGGELRLVSNLRTSTFDKYNPFTIKGSAPAYLSDLLFDSLLVGAMDSNSATAWASVSRRPAGSG